MIDSHELSDVERQWPSLAAAAPPLVPPPPADGVHHLSALEVFAHLAHALQAGRFRLRAPATAAETLCGPFRAMGDCLDPISREGDLHWYDPDLPADDGDFVLVKWDQHVLAEIMERPTGRAWLAKYGKHPGPIATKLLKHHAGELYLVTNESALPLGANRILGVMRRTLRNGVELYSAPTVAQIGLNAATTTYSAADAGPDTYNAGTVPGSPNYYLRIDGAGVPPGSVVRAILTSDLLVAAAGQLGSIFMNLDWGAGSQASDIIECYDTVQHSYATQREFTGLPADTAWTLTVRVAAPGSSVATFKNTRVHVEVIKR